MRKRDPDRGSSIPRTGRLRWKSTAMVGGRGAPVGPGKAGNGSIRVWGLRIRWRKGSSESGWPATSRGMAAVFGRHGHRGAPIGSTRSDYVRGRVEEGRRRRRDGTTLLRQGPAARSPAGAAGPGADGLVGAVVSTKRGRSTNGSGFGDAAEQGSYS